MSVLARNRPQRRDSFAGVVSADWTIPSPLDQVGGSSYRYLTSDTLRIAAVVACVGLRSGAFAQLPLKAYQQGTKAKEVETQPELFTAPSSLPVVVPSVWKTQMSISRDIWGYAAGLIQGVDAAGYVSKVDWMCPDSIRARQETVGGPIRWWLNGAELDSSLVFHIPSRWVTPGNPVGISPLQQSGLVELAKQAQDYGRDWFRNGAVPSSILYSDEKLTTEQADGILATIKRRWKRNQPAVVGSGFRYEQVSANANESQFLETLQRVAADIAISFNLPPEMIAAAVASGSITYANREQNVQQYLMQSINPDLVVIQEVIGLHMRPGTYARWSTGAFLRADLKTRYDSYQVGLNAGFLDVDEVRDWEELGEMARGPDVVDARNLAEMIQKLYLGVGQMITADEARQIVNQAGGTLPLGFFTPPGGGSVQAD